MEEMEEDGRDGIGWKRWNRMEEMEEDGRDGRGWKRWKRMEDDGRGLSWRL